MADESMVRNLAAQAAAIWPQESVLVADYGLPAECAMLDLGCGTGEIASRLAEQFPSAHVLGVDIIDAHLSLARERFGHIGERLEFRRGDAFELDFPGGGFDFAVCRHLLQSVPHPGRVIGQLARVLKPGGRLHVLAEDYAMMHFDPSRLDHDDFFHNAVVAFGERTGTDLRVGRRCYTLLREAGFTEVTVRYLVVDTLRTDRELFAAIWTAWRDGYAEAIAEHSGWPLERVLAHWEDMIACIRDPDGYAVWNIPIVSGVKAQRRNISSQRPRFSNEASDAAT